MRGWTRTGRRRPHGGIWSHVLGQPGQDSRRNADVLPCGGRRPGAPASRRASACTCEANGRPCRQARAGGCPLPAVPKADQHPGGSAALPLWNHHARVPGLQRRTLPIGLAGSLVHRWQAGVRGEMHARELALGNARTCNGVWETRAEDEGKPKGVPREDKVSPHSEAGGRRGPAEVQSFCPTPVASDTAG